ncbi:MAG: DNA mismatch repair protein MutS [Candidatus Omnitrophota bacterium]
MSTSLTPMMRQYLSIKEDNKDAILFFRLGDFYEMFFDDAKEATRILHITLTSREAGKGNKVPMCGIPHHAAKNYIARLIKHGKKVAICEQVEKPEPGKKLVAREITKIITPGTFIADDILEESLNHYILSLKVEDGIYGVAYADISTGEFRITELDSREDLFSELYKISPAECLIPEGFSKGDEYRQVSDINLGALTVQDDWMFDRELSEKEIKGHFSVKSLSGFGCQELPRAVGAAGALLRYLKNTQKSSLTNIDAISTYRVSQFMTIDRNSQRNLELVQNIEDLSTTGTLLEVLDETNTPMGKRRLKKWLLNPLLEPEAVDERLDAVEYFRVDRSIRKNARGLLSRIHDIERLSNRANTETANARDIMALSASLKNVKELKGSLKGASGKIKEIADGLDDFEDVTGWVDECLLEDPPVSLKEGGLIKDGYSPEVDELRDILTNSKAWLSKLQKREIERTGISSLKVGYNKIFGYHIEVTNANLDAVPPDYVRKQTLTNAERFITPELKEYESKIIGAEERIKEVECEIFCRLRARIGSEFERLKRTADYTADMDVLSSLAEVAVKNHYVRPVVNNGRTLRITDGRHPVLEKVLKEKEFIPNDVLMDDKEGRIFIITGSNMAGKSTFIRQVALLTIMAQMGSFVPAKGAEVGMIDRIFTRVGASDRLYKGMSTFMVEMVEAANILNNATDRSLLILDEVGRGTSTFDGVSIAWAIVEFIHDKLSGAKTLFATHYHELTELSQVMNGIKNYNLAVRQWKGEVVFLYKVIEGSCDESFGIHVAKLAGLPEKVVIRAREILYNLHNDSVRGNIKTRFKEKESGEKQLSFFDPVVQESPVVEKLKKLDLDSLTPLDALNKLVELKREVSENGKDKDKRPE